MAKFVLSDKSLQVMNSEYKVLKQLRDLCALIRRNSPDIEVARAALTEEQRLCDRMESLAPPPGAPVAQSLQEAQALQAAVAA